MVPASIRAKLVGPSLSAAYGMAVRTSALSIPGCETKALARARGPVRCWVTGSNDTRGGNRRYFVCLPGGDLGEDINHPTAIFFPRARRLNRWKRRHSPTSDPSEP